MGSSGEPEEKTRTWNDKKIGWQAVILSPDLCVSPSATHSSWTEIVHIRRPSRAPLLAGNGVVHVRCRSAVAGSLPGKFHGELDVAQLDSEQLRELLEAHGAALTLYARQWCHVPEDALQEALIELLRLPEVPEQPAAWLFTTVRRRAMNLARSEQRRTRHHAQAAEQKSNWFIEDDSGPFEPSELSAMLSRLPALEREIVIAKVWGDLTYAQIAQLVELSTSAVHRRYQHALALLGTMFSEKLNESR